MKKNKRNYNNPKYFTTTEAAIFLGAKSVEQIRDHVKKRKIAKKVNGRYRIPSSFVETAKEISDTVSRKCGNSPQKEKQKKSPSESKKMYLHETYFAARNIYGEFCRKNPRHLGSMPIAFLHDALKEKGFLLPIEKWHKALLSWEFSKLVSLTVCNLKESEKRWSEGIKSPRGQLFYVSGFKRDYWNALSKGISTRASQIFETYSAEFKKNPSRAILDEFRNEFAEREKFVAGKIQKLAWDLCFIREFAGFQFFADGKPWKKYKGKSLDMKKKAIATIKNSGVDAKELSFVAKIMGIGIAKPITLKNVREQVIREMSISARIR